LRSTGRVDANISYGFNVVKPTIARGFDYML
jgi:hypothetical protein